MNFDCSLTLSVPEQKARLRKEIRSRRRALDNDTVLDASLAVSKRLIELPVIKNAGLILSYMPAKNELDVRSVNTILGSQGKRIAYPLCIEDGGLRLFVPESEDAFTVGSYGILEPDIDRSCEVMPDELDAIIVPAVAFTKDCMRLGQGGGYYDRLLAKTNAATVGVGYDFQLLVSLPLEAHDRPLDFVVLPSAVFTSK